MWLVLAFASAALLGLYDVAKKQSLRGNAVMPVLFLNTLFCSALFVPFILLSANGVIGEDSMVFVAATGFHDHALILLKAFIVLSSWILGYFAIKHLPLTIVGPINATRPVMTLVGALLIFGESLNAWQWCGVVLAIISFFLLSRSGKKEGINFSHNRWIWFLVGAALLGATSGLYDKYLIAPVEHGGAGVNRMAVQSWYNLYQCIIMGVLLLILWYPNRQSTTPFKWRGSIVLISLFLSLADFAYFYALSYPDAMISVVSMVRRGSVVVSFLFGAAFFHEKNLHSKAVDLLLVIAGMICLWIGTSNL